LPGHTFLITSLDNGKLTVRFDDQEKFVKIGPGYMEVNPDNVLIVTEIIEGIGEDISKVLSWGIKFEEKH